MVRNTSNKIDSQESARTSWKRSSHKGAWGVRGRRGDRWCRSAFWRDDDDDEAEDKDEDAIIKHGKESWGIGGISTGHPSQSDVN